MDIFSVIIILKTILVIAITGSLIFFGLAACSIYTNLTSGVPWAKIPLRSLEQIFREINLPPASLIYDLGAGDGRVVFLAERLGHRAIGYELSLYPYLKAQFKKYFSRSEARFRRQDFFQQDLSRADAVFIFLVGKVMDRVGRKLKSELKTSTVVISYGFTIPGWRLDRTIMTKPSLTYVDKK